MKVGGCSGTCGNGTQLYSRECNNPAPSPGADDCGGHLEKAETCDTKQPCPPSVLRGKANSCWEEYKDEKQEKFLYKKV